MSAAAACAPPPPPRVGMFTFGERMAPRPPPPPPPARPEGAESSVDPQLWLACAGSMCTVPPVGAAVYYFPQGHAEQASAAVDLSATRVPPVVACRVLAVSFMAEPETDDIFVRIRLVPLRPGEPVVDVGDADAMAPGGGNDGQQPRTASFAKTLTQSDASNGSGMSVPRFCAQTILPALDYGQRPPVQSVYARDVHGVEWTFRHIFRGTPRRHLLTTGWSNFVSAKKLLPGDNVVFLRHEDGGIHVGLRRTKRGSLSGWGDAYGSLSSNGKVQAADVVAAATLAAAGEPFEVVHYPRASSPEFCVRAAAVSASMQVQWTSGQRFKMAFETEDASRISWLMGAIAGVQPADPSRWPRSPWRLLQVTWDEAPELLGNVHRVSPWLVEPVSSMPNLHMPPPFSASRKKPRIPPYNNESILLEGQQLFDTAFPRNHPLPPAPKHDRGFIVPSFPFPEYGYGSAAAGIQGARQAQFIQMFSDPNIGDLQRSLLFCAGIRAADHRAPATPRISTDLTLPRQDAPSSPPSAGADGAKAPGVVMLFGRAILTEEQMKSSSSSGVPSSPRAVNRGSSSNTSDGSGSDVTQTQVSPTMTKRPSWMSPWSGDNSPSQWGLEAGQCKVFVESDAIGRNLDLSALGSFEELYARLSAMFCIDNAADLGSHVLYLTAAGEAKHVGDEPFSAFVKSARRITILSDAGSDNL
ncbi:hypothetical protein U9M48_033205 [Paspalum notatum var. saurae]|uniref:Auxin response factor n=1 Tax=Paspalum notatum var. saurae TaxID=547442 RepID=A0AAQ3X6E7_PASNO